MNRINGMEANRRTDEYMISEERNEEEHVSRLLFPSPL
jgi:hypothetical protein